MERILEERLLKLQERFLRLGERFLGSEAQSEQLLSGIPDEITLSKIVTKLPWRDCQILSSASRGWYNASRNSEVYDARVSSHSTETFVLVKWEDEYVGELALLCLRDNSCFVLPPIPKEGIPPSSQCTAVDEEVDEEGPEGIPSSSSCIALDGKVYVLGGMFDDISDKVYVLDLAGHRPWAQCASMQVPRSHFACGVVDGKIYVFGGSGSKGELLRESEVYDPEGNTWSPISPMPSLRRGHEIEVAVVGEELVVCSELVVDEDDQTDFADFMEFYHPVKDEWRKVESSPMMQRPIFAAQGKLYSMNDSGFLVHNFDGNSWTQLGSHSFAAIESFDSLNFKPFSVLCVGEELLATGYLCTTDAVDRRCLLRSIGFGSEKKEVAWLEERDGLGDKVIYFMCPIQL